jgi:hypothetical protein
MNGRIGSMLAMAAAIGIVGQAGSGQLRLFDW